MVDSLKDINSTKWFVRFYVGDDWPVIKSEIGIELECVGATREQAEVIATKLNTSLYQG